MSKGGGKGGGRMSEGVGCQREGGREGVEFPKERGRREEGGKTILPSPPLSPSHLSPLLRNWSHIVSILLSFEEEKNQLT